MPNIKNVKLGYNKFCGPAVLSILTGRDTDECARVISGITGDYRVTGVRVGDLIKAASKLGFDSEGILNSGSSLFGSIRNLIHRDGIYIFMVANHFVVIEIMDKKAYFCDNHTKEPIPAASSARLSMPVLSIIRVSKREDVPIIEASIISETIRVEIGEDIPYINAYRDVLWDDGRMDSEPLGSICFTRRHQFEEFKKAFHDKTTTQRLTQ